MTGSDETSLSVLAEAQTPAPAFAHDPPRQKLSITESAALESACLAQPGSNFNYRAGVELGI
jgi:hypothetical protein